MNNLKYCSRYRCSRVLPKDFEGDTCPYCKSKDYDWDHNKKIKPLPPEAYEIECKCKDCGSTEELTYREKTDYGTFFTGNYYTCKTCVEKWNAEHARQEAMNYILLNNYDDELEFFDNKSDAEAHFENMVKDSDHESMEAYTEDMVLLKVEKTKEKPKLKDFQARNMIHYDYEWYKVEEVIQPEIEYDGDWNINI